MLMDVQAFSATTAEQSLDHEMAGRGFFERASLVDTSHPAPLAEGNDTDRAVLRRGAKMMVLFRGCPCSTAAGSLREAGVTIGLALAPGELPAMRGLEDYSYVFISTGRGTRSTLAEAVADLERNSWSVDDNPVEAPAA